VVGLGERESRAAGCDLENWSAALSHATRPMRVSLVTTTNGMPTRRDRLAAEFERHRGHLRAVAYRMLGSVAEAEDAVQEAWLRLDRTDPGGTDDLRGWLTVVVGRICLDMLRKRKSRREELAGSWLPEPIIRPATDPEPERDTVMADSVGLALLVVLESLTPAERLAFVLHDVFGIPFDEIAPVVERSPAATRQLASRARRRIRAQAPEPDADLTVQRRVVDAFLAAAREGDFEALIRVLDPNVVVRIDGGPNAPRPFARQPLVGAEAVARATKGLQDGAIQIEPAIVNGAAGLIVRYAARSLVAAFTVANGRIVEIDIVADPDKLRGLDLD
jgi:RNA polymerase sigma-70 factor, ECF subfamily